MPAATKPEIRNCPFPRLTAPLSKTTPGRSRRPTGTSLVGNPISALVPRPRLSNPPTPPSPGSDGWPARPGPNSPAPNDGPPIGCTPPPNQLPAPTQETVRLQIEPPRRTPPLSSPTRKDLRQPEPLLTARAGKTNEKGSEKLQPTTAGHSDGTIFQSNGWYFVPQTLSNPCKGNFTKKFSRD